MAPLRTHMSGCRFLARFALISSFLLFGLLLFQSCVLAQFNGGVPGGINQHVELRTGMTVRFTVLDKDKKPLTEEALVKLTDQNTGRTLFQTTRNSVAEFTDIPPTTYLVEVGALGYLGWHAQIKATDNAHDFVETVTLSRDPSTIDLNVNDVKQLPSSARKSAEKALKALQLSNFAEARKNLEAADHKAPENAYLQFLLGYLSYQEGDQQRALSYLTNAAKLDPKNIQAQNLLGQVLYRRGEYEKATAAEETVIAVSPQSVVAHRILANSYLKLRQFDNARDNAQWLFDQGGSEGAAAQLILGQALAGLGKNEEAAHFLNAYLETNPPPAVAAEVRQTLANLSKATTAKTSAIADPDLLSDAASSAGMPADIDSEHPSVVPGVQCPVDLLEQTGLRTKELVDSVARFSAIEHMTHERITADGIPRSRETRQYNYIVAINESKDTALSVQEFRDSGNLEMPQQITTTGLPVLAIAFHPLFQPDFDMNCEGLGNWNGQPAWLVHFQQKDGKPSRLRSYVVNKQYYPVNLKGRAWILASNFQIVHLETDLVKGIPDVKLFTEHTTVNYGPVQFPRSKTELWLPEAADMYVHLGKARFHRSESFDHFMLFATEATQKTKLPHNDSTQDSPKSSFADPK